VMNPQLAHPAVATVMIQTQATIIPFFSSDNSKEQKMI
jgi:hypothetical protein